MQCVGIVFTLTPLSYPLTPENPCLSSYYPPMFMNPQHLHMEARGQPLWCLLLESWYLTEPGLQAYIMVPGLFDTAAGDARSSCVHGRHFSSCTIAPALGLAFRKHSTLRCISEPGVLEHFPQMHKQSLWCTDCSRSSISYMAA